VGDRNRGEDLALLLSPKKVGQKEKRNSILEFTSVLLLRGNGREWKDCDGHAG
jgi:hypothetical protein